MKLFPVRMLFFLLCSENVCKSENFRNYYELQDFLKNCKQTAEKCKIFSEIEKI